MIPSRCSARQKKILKPNTENFGAYSCGIGVFGLIWALVSLSQDWAEFNYEKIPKDIALLLWSPSLCMMPTDEGWPGVLGADSAGLSCFK